MQVRVTSTREARGVRLHPTRRVAGHAVFPRSEPKEDKPDRGAPRVLYQPVDRREVIATLLGLDQVPIHRGNDGVEVQLAKLSPRRSQGVGIRSDGIAEFPSQDEERLAVHLQLLDLTFGDEPRDRGIGPELACEGKQACGGGEPES